jgi:hypothetical protein
MWPESITCLWRMDKKRIVPKADFREAGQCCIKRTGKILTSAWRIERKSDCAEKGLKYFCRTDQTGRPHEQGAQSGDETIGCSEIRGSLPGSIQDQKLVPDENGFRDHGTEDVRAQKPGDRTEHMNETHDEIAHYGIAARTASAGNYGEHGQFAIDRA